MKTIFSILIGLFFSMQLLAKGDDPIISLSPVPLTGSHLLMVTLLKPAVQISTVELRNLIGRRLQLKSFPATSEYVVFTDMDTYPNGLYVIIVKDSFGKIVETTKFIINK